MQKTKKKYSIKKAQVGTNTSNQLNNLVDPTYGNYMNDKLGIAPTENVDVPNMPDIVSKRATLPQRANVLDPSNYSKQPEQPGNPGTHGPATQQGQSNQGPQPWNLATRKLNPLVEGFNAAASATTAIANTIASNKASRNEFNQYLQQRQGNGYENMESQGNNNNPAYFKMGGKTKKKYQVGGQQPDAGLTYTNPEDTNDYSGDVLTEFKAGGWIKGAINPAHKGYCTPMSKSTCTPRRKALARRFKSGDLHKGQLGGNVGQWDDMGWDSTYDDEDEIGNLLAQTGGGFTQQNIGASHASGINEAYFADDINSVLANNKRTNTQGVYTPDQQALIQKAYIYKATQPQGRTPEQLIQGFYGSPVNQNDPTDILRQKTGRFNLDPVANYYSTPNTNVQQKPAAQAGGGFSPAEQQIADRYTQMGYSVSKDASGQLKFNKNGVIANPATSAQNKATQAASQAATGNPQAPVSGSTPQTQVQAQQSAGQFPTKDALRKKYANNPYLSDQGRYNWGNKLDTEFQSSQGNVRDAVYSAARQNKLNPALLYSSAMEEGMSGSVDKKASGNASEAYVDWVSKNKDKAADYPVDGFYNYGLDTFAGNAKDLEKEGYLPKGFSNNFTTFDASTKNESSSGMDLKAPAFKTDADALMAKSAMMRQSQDQLAAYTKQSGVKLTPKQQDFFLLANYNGGEGNMQKMIKSYQDKGYLKDDSFIDNASFKPASYSSIYNNVQARLQSAKELNDEGYFKDYNANPTPAQNSTVTQPAAPTSTMKAGGLSRSSDYGSKSHPYPMVKKVDFAGGNRSYPIPTKADGRDALRLAGLHHRPDVKAKVYAKYPSLKKQYGGVGTSGDLYNDLSEYEIDKNMIMQAGGIQQVGGLPDSMADRANVEAEKGEVYTDQQGNMQQVDPNGNTHEQGGEMLPDVHRVLENTSRLRGDKISKYLRLNPEQIKVLTGLDTNSSMSHAQALIEGNANLEKERGKLVKNIELAGKGKNYLDKYAQNSTKLNIDSFQAIPTKEELFNRLFDHQEMTKAALGINNDGSSDQEMKYGGKKYTMKAQNGVTAYPGNKSGQTTPAGNSDAFPDNTTVDEYVDQLKKAGVNVANVKSNADLQRAAYTFALKNNPDAIRQMWQEGIQNQGYDKAVKAGLVYDKDDATSGVKRGQFKPGVLQDPENLQKLAELYPDNNLGKRLVNLAVGPRMWTDNDIPPQKQAPRQYNDKVQPSPIVNNLQRVPQPKSNFNQPLNWYDLASPIGAYVAGSERLAEKYNPTKINQLQLHQVDPTAALNANETDFNTAVKAVQETAPNNIGAQLANISNLASRKYALNNQVIGNYENQNAQIKNQEIQYNTQARDRQAQSDQQSREAFEEKVLTGKAKQQEQKLTALDSLYKTVAENAALNRNGDLIQKMSKAFDQYGNYNGYNPTFTANTPIQPNQYTAPQNMSAKGVTTFTPGKSYKLAGKVFRYDGNNLVEVK